MEGWSVCWSTINYRSTEIRRLNYVYSVIGHASPLGKVDKYSCEVAEKNWFAVKGSLIPWLEE